MEKEWIPIVGTLLGVLIGGAISIISKWLEIKTQSNRERRNILLKKIEELHELLSHYVILIHDYYINITVYEESDDETHQSKILKVESLKLLSPINLIHTKLMIYAPELEKEWDESVDAITAIQESGSHYLLRSITKEQFMGKANLIEQPIKLLLEKLEKKASSVLK